MIQASQARGWSCDITRQCCRLQQGFLCTTGEELDVNPITESVHLNTHLVMFFIFTVVLFIYLIYLFYLTTDKVFLLICSFMTLIFFFSLSILLFILSVLLFVDKDEQAIGE